MSSFTTQLVVSPMPDGRRWKVMKPFTYHIGSERSKDTVEVPYGFITDFASIPWLFWSLLPRWGKYGKAAVIHDWLYQNYNVTSMVVVRKATLSIDRKGADDIFYEAMLVEGTKPWKAKVMYWAVRLFGWAAWKGGN